jgi:predicted dehydrogenase
MKILVFGLGSIGQRHVRLMQELYGEKIEIAACRQRKNSWVISDKLGADLNSDPCEFYGIKAFYRVEDALNWEPDVAFIQSYI